MIIDFKFKNYMSFADECDFTMLANKDKSHEENLIVEKKDRISKTRMIYGANASGKSSFINAMLFVVSFIANSNALLEKRNKIEIYQAQNLFISLKALVSIHPHSGWLLFFGHSPYPLA